MWNSGFPHFWTIKLSAARLKNWVVAIILLVWLLQIWNSKNNFVLLEILPVLHPVLGRQTTTSQTLIQNFLICICEMIKDQFGLFLSIPKHGNLLQPVLRKMSIYHQGFVNCPETVRFESKLWVRVYENILDMTWKDSILKRTLLHRTTLDGCLFYSSHSG